MKKANAPAPADVQVLLPAAMMNGKAVVDSREVARMLGRPHKNLLADIHRYISAMERRKADGLNFQPVARDFQLVDFFVPSTYTNDHNQTFPCYLLTQKGCEMVANKLTGEKGILFTAAYVNAFHALQEQAQAGAMVPTVRAAPAALPAAPAAPGIAERAHRLRHGIDDRLWPWRKRRARPRKPTTASAPRTRCWAKRNQLNTAPPTLARGWVEFFIPL